MIDIWIEAKCLKVLTEPTLIYQSRKSSYALTRKKAIIGQGQENGEFYPPIPASTSSSLSEARERATGAALPCSL
jgi:hypothetical protein